ncbi:hypothetical protein BH20CHL6_BH20CHL6_02790 [soil metagenome]
MHDRRLAPAPEEDERPGEWRERLVRRTYMGDRFMAAREPPRQWLMDAEDLPVGAIIAGYLAITLQAALAYFPFTLILFAAPLVVSGGIYLGWVAALVAVARLRVEHPWLALALPVGQVVAFFLLLDYGVGQFGWRQI